MKGVGKGEEPLHTYGDDIYLAGGKLIAQFVRERKRTRGNALFTWMLYIII